MRVEDLSFEGWKTPLKEPEETFMIQKMSQLFSSVMVVECFPLVK